MGATWTSRGESSVAMRPTSRLLGHEFRDDDDQEEPGKPCGIAPRGEGGESVGVRASFEAWVGARTAKFVLKLKTGD